MFHEAVDVMVGKRPTVVEIEASCLEELLARTESQALQADDYQTIETLVKSYTSLIDMLQNKNTSLARLRKLLFGASTEKLRDLLPDGQLQPTIPPEGEPPDLSGDPPVDDTKGSKDDLPASEAGDNGKKKGKRARAKRRRQVQRFQASRCRS